MEGTIRCSFCRKSQDMVGRLIASPDRGDGTPREYICNECVEICHISLSGQKQQKPIRPDLPSIPAPQEIKAFLDDYVVGHDVAKKKLAVAVYNHAKLLWLNRVRTGDQPELVKSNILLIGPTGTGKTLLAQTLAKALSIPFVIGDATTLTEHGYVGEDVESLLTKLLRAAGGNLQQAQRGIIYIDEIDKIGKVEGAARSNHRDVSGEGVQQCLLKMLEGAAVSLPNPGPPGSWSQQERQVMDTTDILFICGGTFAGLEGAIRRRMGRGLGFGASDDQNGHFPTLESVQPEDLIECGLIPEFVSRLPVVGVLGELDEESLVEILIRPKNAIVRQYQEIFGFDNVNLRFADGALRMIAQKALVRKTGARGLRAIMEELMTDLMYAVPNAKKNGNKCFLEVTERFIVMPQEERQRQIPVILSLGAA